MSELNKQGIKSDCNQYMYFWKENIPTLNDTCEFFIIFKFSLRHIKSIFIQISLYRISLMKN